MPIVTMPNGDRVNFPDTMSREEIRAKILQKFPEADPDRGFLAKATEFGRGEARGLVQNAGTVDKLAGMLPSSVSKAAEAMPMIGAPLKAVRALSRAAGPWANERLGSEPEQAGRFVGRDVLPMVGPGGLGGGIGRVAAEKATQLGVPLGFLAYMHAFPHAAIGTLLTRPQLYSDLQALAMRFVPGMGMIGSELGRAGEKVLGGEAGQMLPEGSPDETQTPAPAATPAVPPPAQPRTAPAAPRPDPRPDADTDAPVANRSGKSDRFQFLGGATN